MIKDKKIALDEDMVRLEGHKVSLGEDQSSIKIKIIKAYKESGLTPPYLKELVEEHKMDPARAKEVLTLLVDEGILLKVKEDLYFHTDNINDIKNRMIEFLKEKRRNVGSAVQRNGRSITQVPDTPSRIF